MSSESNIIAWSIHRHTSIEEFESSQMVTILFNFDTPDLTVIYAMVPIVLTIPTTSIYWFPAIWVISFIEINV